MACSDSSDEEENPARKTEASLAAIEHNGSALTVIASVETEGPAVVQAITVSSSQNTDTDSLAELPAGGVRISTSAIDLAPVDDADEDEKRSTCDKRKSNSVSGYIKNVLNKTSFDRDRAMSDCSNLTEARQSLDPRRSSFEQAGGTKINKDKKISFDGDDADDMPERQVQVGLADKLSQVQFRISKSISLGMDGIAKAGMKRAPTGRKHKPKTFRSVDHANEAPESDSDETSNVKYRKAASRKASTKRPQRSKGQAPRGGGKRHSIGDIIHTSSEDDVTYRASVARKGTTRRPLGPKRSAPLQDCEHSDDQDEVSGSSSKGQRNRKLASKLSFSNIFKHSTEVSVDSAKGQLAKSESNPMAAISVTPACERRGERAERGATTNNASAGGPSPISKLFHKRKK